MTRTRRSTISPLHTGSELYAEGMRAAARSYAELRELLDQLHASRR